MVEMHLPLIRRNFVNHLRQIPVENTNISIHCEIDKNPDVLYVQGASAYVGVTGRIYRMIVVHERVLNMFGVKVMGDAPYWGKHGLLRLLGEKTPNHSIASTDSILLHIQHEKGVREYADAIYQAFSTISGIRKKPFTLVTESVGTLVCLDVVCRLLEEKKLNMVPDKILFISPLIGGVSKETLWLLKTLGINAEGMPGLRDIMPDSEYLQALQKRLRKLENFPETVLFVGDLGKDRIGFPLGATKRKMLKMVHPEEIPEESGDGLTNLNSACLNETDGSPLIHPGKKRTIILKGASHNILRKQAFPYLVNILNETESPTSEKTIQVYQNTEWIDNHNLIGAAVVLFFLYLARVKKYVGYVEAKL